MESQPHTPSESNLQATRRESISRLSPGSRTSRGSSRSRVRRPPSEDSDKAGRSWARTVDDPWDACILTLDGGGIRGYSSLLLLRELMHHIWLWEEKLEEEEHDERQSQPTASRRGRSPLASEIVDESIETEAKYGVSLPEVTTTNTTVPGAARNVQADKLTSEASVRKTFVEADLLPCHYFDFMFGTSTGGLIATILGRLRMTVTEGLDLYRKVGDDLFGRRRSYVPGMTKFYHQPLERAVQEVVGSRCQDHLQCDGKQDLYPWEADRINEMIESELELSFDVDQPRVCQSCCLTATHDEQISEAYLLRSYPHYYAEDVPNYITQYNEGADLMPIWKVTRATTAAPFYFDMISHEIDGVTKSFKDGGIRENNPSGAALSEFHSLYAGKADNPAILLSVGTGRPDESTPGADGFAATWPGPIGQIPFVAKFLEKRAVVQNALIKYTAGEKQHHQIREHARGENTWYKRLNVSHGLQGMALDSWERGLWHERENTPGGKTLSLMESVTQAYIERVFDPHLDSYAPPGVMIRQAAEKLVRQRRAREKLGGIRWETFVGRHLPVLTPTIAAS